MANKVIRPPGGMPTAQQAAPQKQVQLDPEQCPEMFCTYCDCPTFVSISRFRMIPVLLMPPEGGHVTLTNVHCTNCNRELDINLAKKWAHLKPEERLQAREMSQEAMAQKAAKSAKKVKIKKHRSLDPPSKKSKKKV